MLRVLVCDDEPIAVSRLSELLARFEDVDVVATASNGDEALSAIRTSTPDLIFLDIEMPGRDGFDVVGELSRIDPGRAPLVTFVTAFRHFAPEAFDSGAVDFLSKPVRMSRLERSLDRARRLVASRNAEKRLLAAERTVDALRRAQDGRGKPHVWVHRRGEVVRVDLDNVDRVSAEGPYVRLHLRSGTHLHRESISSIEARLSTMGHLRVHRSHLVALAHVAGIRRTLHGASELILQNGDRIPVGRSHAREVRRRLLDKGISS
jgi:DNA-binding LytR/AlgR family response regulator